MANKFTNPQYYSDIAAAIRAKNGSSDTYTPAQMAAAILDIPSGSDELAKMILQGQTDNGTLDLSDLDITLIGSYALQGYGNKTALHTLILPDTVQEIETYGIFDNKQLTTIEGLENVTTLGMSAIMNNVALAGKLVLPNLTKAAAGSLGYNSALTKLYTPKLKQGYTYDTFSGCNALRVIDYGVVSQGLAFLSGGSYLKIAAFRHTPMVTCDNLACLGSKTSPLRTGTGYVLVPRDLIATYQTATNWSAIYSGGTQFLALEDYTVDGTTTGLLDDTKIDTLLAA